MGVVVEKYLQNWTYVLKAVSAAPEVPMAQVVDRSAAQSTLNVWQMAQSQLDDVAKIIAKMGNASLRTKIPVRLLMRRAAYTTNGHTR